MKITIAAIGRLKGAEVGLAEEYAKRIPWTLVTREYQPKATEITKRQKEEGDWLLAQTKHSYRIVLDERGKAFSSQQLAGHLKQLQQNGMSHISFLIGGADGHHASVGSAADLSLSLSAMTWPHRLVRLMLAEQVYRSYSLMTGHPYHR